MLFSDGAAEEKQQQKACRNGKKSEAEELDNGLRIFKGLIDPIDLPAPPPSRVTAPDLHSTATKQITMPPAIAAASRKASAS